MIKHRFLKFNPAAFLFPSLAFLTGGILWQFLAFQGALNTSLFPPPLQVLSALLENFTDFKQALAESSLAVLLGFSSSVVLGFALSAVVTLFRPLRLAILPFAVFFQTIPIIAIAPLLVIYFGFGLPTVVASTTIVAIFPIIANSVVALSATPIEPLELFQLYGANRWVTFYRLRLPAAYLGIYTGLQVAAGLAVIGAVAGEFVAGGGLGAMIDAARTQQRIDIVFAALLCLSFLGLCFIGSIQLIHYLLQKWRPYQGQVL